MIYIHVHIYVYTAIGMYMYSSIFCSLIIIISAYPDISSFR